MITSSRLAPLALLLLSSLVTAIWPFSQKRFEKEALIDAGPLGFENIDGRVVAFGDWNGDKR